MTTQQHDHEHGLGGTHTVDGPLRALIIALTITVSVFVAELVAGLLSGSLALLSDAMHMLSDSTGLVLALIATLIGRRAADERSTFGYRRVEVLAAMVNAVVVTAVVIWILVEAIGRIGHNHEIDTTVMIGVGAIGLLANGLSALVLMSHRDASLNMRGAFLHVLVDMMGSVAVIIAGIVIVLTGWTPADTVASLIIVALVLPRSLQLLRDSTNVLLNRAPADVDMNAVEQTLRDVEGVREVHDLHVWSTEGVNILATCHLVLEEDHAPNCDVLDSAQQALRELGIEHSTLQLEEPGHVHHEVVCDVGTLSTERQ